MFQTAAIYFSTMDARKASGILISAYSPTQNLSPDSDRGSNTMHVLRVLESLSPAISTRLNGQKNSMCCSDTQFTDSMPDSMSTHVRRGIFRTPQFPRIPQLWKYYEMGSLCCTKLSYIRPCADEFTSGRMGSIGTFHCASWKSKHTARADTSRCSGWVHCVQSDHLYLAGIAHSRFSLWLIYGEHQNKSDRNQLC